MISSITSRQNDRVKAIRGLRLKKNREAEEAYTFEGKKLFLEACRWQVPLTDVFVTERCLEDPAVAGAVRELEGAGECQCTLVSEAVCEALSQQKTPEGILCRAKKSKKGKPNGRSYVILEDIRDPGNLGTILRTADAMGFDAVVASPQCADIYGEKVIRGSMGSFFHLPVWQCEDLGAEIGALRQAGILICGTSLAGTEMTGLPLDGGGVALILGNESHGISDGLARECDVLWRLPIWGNAESLNVSIAAGIMLYEIGRELHKTSE